MAALRNGWGEKDNYFASKGGDSTVTHQDLDHGHFVWETKGYRWAIDLGSETYALPNMFLPFKGRYNYYRKASRGHNVLNFDDRADFYPADGNFSDQTINVFSKLEVGPACAAAERAKHPNNGCSTGEIWTIDLTSAYSRQLGDGAAARGGDVGDARGGSGRSAASNSRNKQTVKRTFVIPKSDMSVLTVDDKIDARSNPGLNVTWGMHTRAPVTLGGTTARLHDSGGKQELGLAYKSEPSDACGDWQSAAIVLPSTPVPRFDLEGARKVWLVCKPTLTRLQVTLGSSSSSSSSGNQEI